MTKHFMRDLGALATQLQALGNRVEDALGNAIDAILSRDVEAARRVVAGDPEIDELEVRLEEEALKILALHSPVASDLRFLVASIKINNDLERVGDLASNICKRAVDLDPLPPVEAPEEFAHMAQLTRTMFHEALGAMMKRDEPRARALLDLDDEVDSLNVTILARIEARMHEAPEEIAPLLRWSTVVKLVERVADYATNIAEDVIYMEAGEIVRHGN